MGILLFHPEESDIDANLEVNLDIIAIHGLNGDRQRTWTEPKSQKLWLRDFLPKDIPRARVMVFGYDAKPVLASSTAGVEEHARDLLTCLMERREEREAVKRPLIFIGHSLGGLVIKQTLVIAQHEHRYKHIFHSTKGVIFFGTPHQGSSLADYGSALARVPTLLANKPNPALLETLKKDSRALMHLTEKFRRHHENDEKPYAIVSFYETRAMKGTKTLVVEKVSALLTPPSETPTYEQQIPVDATHRDMCRFSSSDDKTYKRAVACIKRIHMGRKTMDVEVGNEHYVVPHTANSNFTGRNDIRRQLKEILIGDGYEVQRAQQRFVLYGLGGSGKTELCLKFAQDYKQSFWGIFWIDASTNEVAEEGFMKIARACKQEANLDSVKTWLSCKEHWLLIIDNADDPTVDVPRLIPSGIKGSVLITTRNPDVQNFASAGSYRVDEMSPEDATALLLKTTALQNIEETEKVLARNVVETLGYLALAIIQAGAVIRQRLIGLDGFCELYSTRKKELLESGRPDDSIDYQRSVYTTWEISIRMIKEMRDSDKHAIFALELLRLFSFMHFDGIRAEIFKQARHNPDPWYENCFFERSLLVQLMPDGWDQMFWGQALKLLVSFSLITVNESNCIAMHPLVHEWSRDRMSEQDLEEGWKTAAMTLAMSTTFERRVSDHKQRKLLLPHMDACLSYSNGQLFSPGPDIHERLVAALKFCMANRESCRAKALDLSLETKKCMEAIYPPDSYSRLNIMLFVAEDMSELGRYAEATDAYQRLLTTLTDLKDPFPNLTVAVTNAVAAKHLELGDPKKAIDMCLEARNKFQPVLGVDDPNFLASLNVIGKAKLAMGSSRDGIKYLEQAYEGSMRTYGEHHTFTLEVMDFLADAYREDGKYKQARAMQTKFVAMLLESYGPDNPRTILEKARLERFRRVRVGVGSILRRKREIAEMEELLATSKGTLGETHTKTLLCLSQLAWNYFQCGAFEKAWLLQEDVVKISTEKWGADSENTEFAVKRLRQIRISIVLRKIFYWWLPKRMLEEDGMWKC